MATEDPEIDRKAHTPTEEDDPRPDFDHFDGFRDTATGLWARIPSLPRPDVSTVGVVMATLYTTITAGAVAVGYGATALTYTHGGVYASLIVAGIFAFAYGYVGLQAVDAVMGERGL